MSICRVAMLAFIQGNLPRYDGTYEQWTDSDLHDMIQWCNDMIDEGLTVEPVDHFNLQGFIQWATKQLLAKGSSPC